MRLHWQLVALVILLSPATGAAQDGGDEGRIQGTRVLTALEANGEQDTTNKNVNTVFLEFGANGRYAVKPPGYEFPGSYKLDSSRTPKGLDVTVGNRTVLALYELTGDTLRVCEGRMERPRELSSSGCSNGAIAVYRRVR